MLVAWPFCLCLLLGVWFCLEALYFSVLCFEKPPWFFGVWWVFTAGCGMLPVGFWFWVRLLVSGLAIPTGVAVTVAELSLNSVQQCSFLLLLGCCSCVAVVGGFVFWCGTVVSVLASCSLHFCCSALGILSGIWDPWVHTGDE